MPSSSWKSAGLTHTLLCAAICANAFRPRHRRAYREHRAAEARPECPLPPPLNEVCEMEPEKDVPYHVIEVERPSN